MRWSLAKGSFREPISIIMFIQFLRASNSISSSSLYPRTTLCAQFLFGCKSPSPSSPLNMFHLGTEVPGPPTHQGLFQRRKRKLDVTHTARLLYPSSPSRFTWISSQFTYSTPFILAIHRHWKNATLPGPFCVPKLERCIFLQCSLKMFQMGKKLFPSFVDWCSSSFPLFLLRWWSRSLLENIMNNGPIQANSITRSSFLVVCSRSSVEPGNGREEITPFSLSMVCGKLEKKPGGKVESFQSWWEPHHNKLLIPRADPEFGFAGFLKWKSGILLAIPSPLSPFTHGSISDTSILLSIFDQKKKLFFFLFPFFLPTPHFFLTSDAWKRQPEGGILHLNNMFQFSGRFHTWPFLRPWWSRKKRWNEGKKTLFFGK